MDDYFTKAVEFRKAWKKITRECSEALSIYKKCSHYLVRGINVSTLPLIWTGESSTRRHEEGERREEVDAWLLQHGFKALRGNSIFCSNSKDQIHSYAGGAKRRFYIIPKNGFKYTWYSETHDLHMLNMSLELTRKQVSIDELMVCADPHDRDIEKALNTNRHHEIHFIGGYWALDLDAMGQMMRNELNGTGFAALARAGRLSPEACAALGFKTK